MRLAHVTVFGADLEVNAWASAVGLAAVRIGPVPASGRAGGRPVEGVSVDEGATEDLRRLARALGRYLTGAPLDWDGPVDLRGTTPFQREVFDALRGIGHGETGTYGGIATAIGRPTAIRAVGATLRRNPFPIVVPCHRVLRQDGELGGYSAGPAVKRRLLAIEAGQTELTWEESA